MKHLARHQLPRVGAKKSPRDENNLPTQVSSPPPARDNSAAETCKLLFDFIDEIAKSQLAQETRANGFLGHPRPYKWGLRKKPVWVK